MHVSTVVDRREDRREISAQPDRARTFTAVASNRQTTNPACPWLDDHLSVATRVDELLAAMTPVEEASLLHLHQISLVVPYEGYTAPIPRLCIPLITEQDGAAGVASTSRASTQLPAPIADAGVVRSVAGRAVRRRDRFGGRDQGRRPRAVTDHQHRPLTVLGAVVREPRRGPVPHRQPGRAPCPAASRTTASPRSSSTSPSTTRRPTARRCNDDSIVSDQALHEVYLPAFSAVVQQARAAASHVLLQPRQRHAGLRGRPRSSTRSSARSGTSTGSSARTATRCTTRRRPSPSASRR